MRPPIPTVDPERLEAILAAFSPEAREIYREVALEGASAADVARRRGLTRDRVRATVLGVRRALTSALEER